VGVQVEVAYGRYTVNPLQDGNLETPKLRIVIVTVKRLTLVASLR